MVRYLIILFALVNFPVWGQITQTVKGKIVDEEMQYPMIGAKVVLSAEDTTNTFKSRTDEEGLFEFKNVPIGKYTLTASYMSYLDNNKTIVVNSGKQNVVNIELQEEVTTKEEVKIVGREAGEVNNNMAMISARQFSVSETDRYAGSRGDPARMVSNFAGVQGADDSRNDIVVRGNSPTGVVWRVEGVDIPNPNHFATSGSTGGPVAILNNKILANSDFFMSAFPAEYGNSIAAVFDVNLRNGNTDKHELTGQFGVLGTQVMAEGPLNREKRSSYLAVGRYSTLSIFQAMNIKIGTDAVPVYGDGAFKFSFPLKSGGHIGVFGIGGASDISIMISEQKEVTEEAFGEGDRDQYFGTAMGVFGITYKKPFSRNTYFKATVAGTYDQQHSRHDFLIRSVDTINTSNGPEYEFQTDSIYPLMGYAFQNFKTAVYASINHKINKRNIIKAGFNFDGYHISQIDTALNTEHTQFITRFDFKGFAAMVQPFVTYKWKISNKMDFTAGIHSQYFSLSDSWSYAEPRLGWRWKLKKGNVVDAGVGLHSQMQPLYQYTYRQPDADGNVSRLNKKMDFTKSFHSAVGYQKHFNNAALTIKTELYYQYLYNIPVEVEPSSFSMINQGSGFQRFYPDKLVNEGTGENYGIELTVRKHFNRSYYFLITGSLFESKYKGSDGVERNTDFNGNYAVNLLAGKEFNINKKNKISVGLKVTTAGGKRYGYANVEESEKFHELIYKDSLFNTRQFKPYFRLDLKINYTLNTKNLTHEIGIDLVNLLNTKNILTLSYAPNLFDPSKDPIAKRYQLGFLPIAYYKIEFSFGKGK